MAVGTWLAERAKSYLADSNRLREVSDDFAGLTGGQWSVVYRAISDELLKCAADLGGAIAADGQCANARASELRNAAAEIAPALSTYSARRWLNDRADQIERDPTP